jgi:hypothetical protein
MRNGDNKAHPEIFEIRPIFGSAVPVAEKAKLWKTLWKLKIAESAVIGSFNPAEPPPRLEFL